MCAKVLEDLGFWDFLKKPTQCQDEHLKGFSDVTLGRLGLTEENRN